MTRFSLIICCLLLASCGKQQNLHPPAGAPLPPKPAAAPAVPTAAELLKPRTTERPDRSDELLTKSQPRADDPFDRPPQ